MADGLTLNDVHEIQADAYKAITRQFRDAAEDNGWEPTPTPSESDTFDPSATATAKENLAHVTGDDNQSADDKNVLTNKPKASTPKASADDGPNINDLRAQAKELGLSAAGSKADLQARIDAASKKEEGDN